MPFTAEESEPFVGSNSQSNHLKRRTGPQHENENNFGNGTYVTSGEDFSKSTSKRSGCGLICYRAQRILCAKPLQDTTQVYYEDSFNDQAWECTFGTSPQDGIWINHSDQVGTIMSSMVWVLTIYSVVTISLLAENNRLPQKIAMIYATICAMALASHAKTMFTDPGSIPSEAVPLPILFEQGITTHAMCSHCNTYKPNKAHHCRICNRCISGMDHHCPWMNNCVGAGNFKHFILFLCYTWIGCAYSLILFSLNYFFCNSEDCTFTPVLVQLVRVMTLLCLCTLLFVSSMLMNVTFGIMTGVGTIDRLKRKQQAADDVAIVEADDVPLKLKDIFGIQGYWTWALPLDPIFEDHDRVLRYSIPARLKREQERESAV